MRILVMGSGGIGGYFGARLALAGNDVVFTARGAHLGAMQTRGLEIRERDGTARTLPVQAVRFPADAGGTVDAILFTVKTYDTAEAAEAIKAVVGPNTVVVPLQNGVDSVDEIGRVVGTGHVLAGTTLMSAKIADPGVIEKLSVGCSTAVGEPVGARSERVVRFVEAFHAAGIPDVVATDDAQQALWEKLMFLAPCASANSATGLPTGPLRALPEGLAMIMAMQREIRAVGLASGVNLPDEVAERVRKLYMNLSEGHTVSMQRDFEVGRRVELESLTGTIVRRGRQAGVPTPVFDTAYAILRTRALQFGGVS